MNSRSTRLELDSERAWLGGVCAGLSRYLALDEPIVRVGTVVAALFIPKIMVSAYLIGWLILDRRGETDTAPGTKRRYEQS